MKDTILFTGGSGLLAVCWSRYIANTYNVCLALHERSISLPRTSCLKLDLSSLDSILSALQQIKPTIVVNSAAITSIEHCEQNPQHAFLVNTKLAINIAKACNTLGIKLVHISTDHIFDGTSSYYTEASMPNPINVYGRTKLQAEIGIKPIAKNGLIIRTNFFDQGPLYRQSFSDWIIQSLVNNEKVYLFHDVYYTPIHVKYLASHVHQLLALNMNGTFNISGPSRLSKFEFGTQLARALSLNTNLIYPVSIEDRLDLTKRPHDMSLSNAKLVNIVNDSSILADHLGLLPQPSSSL